MKTIVEVFEPGQLESLSRIEAGELVDQAIAHHAGQLSRRAVEEKLNRPATAGRKG